MRALVGLFLVLWLIIGSLGSSLFWLTPYATVAAGMRQPNLSAYFTPVPVPLSPARYTGLRLGLAVVAGLAAAALGWRARGRRPCRPHLLAEGRWASQRLLGAWRRLSAPQRWVVLLVGAGALAARGWLLVHCPITDDELTSYDCYVHPGLALTASNYSLPNNHILYNLLVGVLGKLLRVAPDLRQRLPAVLVGVGLLPVSYLLLLHYLRYGAATLALGLFTLLPTPTFYAVAGRGYSLTLAATVAGFFATLVLLQRRGPRRLAEVVFVLSGVAGLYAVPAHAWVLVALGGVRLLAYLQQPRRLAKVNLARLALATAGVAATTLLLYAPVGAVSGWPALFQNPYVASPLGWAAFWRGFYNPYLLDAASRLWGHGRWSTAALAGLAVLAPLALAKAKPPLRAVGWLSYALTFMPLLLLLAQRIYLPPRTLLASAFGAYVLVAALGQQASQRVQWPRGRGWPAATAALLLLGLLGYGAYHLCPEASQVRALAARTAALRREYAWLRARRPQRIWLDEESRALQGIYWRHLGLLAGAPLPLVVARALPMRSSSQVVEYAVLARQGANGPLPARPAPAYADEYVYAWRLAPAGPGRQQN